MGIKTLNEWINGLLPRAEVLAALDKVIKPAETTAEETARIREMERQYYEKHKKRLGGRASCFEPVTGVQMRDAKPKSATAEQWESALRFAYTKVDGVSTRMSACWLYAGIFKDGPKVYCPTLEEWEALARVELRVPLSSYRQPFDTTIIVIPEGAFGPISEAVGVPGFCAMRSWRHGDDNGLIAGIVVGANHVNYELDFRLSWITDGTEQIEHRLKAINEASKQMTTVEDVFALQEDEPAAMEKIKRAALNACLLLSQHAPTLRGKKLNAAHAAKLEEKQKNKRLPAHIRAANEKQLHMMPTVYGFHQHITICEHVREEEEPNPTGTRPPLQPHWRRGHWLHQVCGTGRADRKLQFRPAKLVNAHLLSGPLHNTRVTMTTS